MPNEPSPGPDADAVHMTAFNATQMEFWHEVKSWNGQAAPNTDFYQALQTLTQHVLSMNHLDHYNSNATDALRLRSTRQEVKNLDCELTECQQNLANTEAQLTTAHNTITQYQQEIERLKLTNGAAGGIKRQEIAAPEKFTGDRKAYPAFKAQLQAKLAGDAHKFHNDQHRMLYISSLLQGNAYAMVLNYIVDGVVSLPTVKDFWNVLDMAYDDPDKKGSAKRELKTLRQGNREFSAYFADFQRLMTQLKYDDEAKKSYIEDGICEELTVLLESYDVPDDWNEYIQLLQKLDSRIRARAPHRRKARPTAGPDTPRPTARVAAGAPAASTVHPTANPNYHGPAPMDLSASRKSPEQQRRYNERMAAGSCTTCGEAGHFRKDCPQKPARMAAYQANVSATEASEVQSGKE